MQLDDLLLVGKCFFIVCKREAEVVDLGFEDDKLSFKVGILGAEAVRFSYEPVALVLKLVGICYARLGFCEELIKRAAEDIDNFAQSIYIRVIRFTRKYAFHGAFGDAGSIGDLF